MAEIDFTRNRWGHALHADTWREVPREPSFLNWLLRRDDGVRHYHALVHVTPPPRVGDTILYLLGGGGVGVAEIIRVDCEVDPRDMYFLKLRVTPEQRDGRRRGEFQSRVVPWLLACFGETIARNREERNHRFLEEALELVQACGCTRSEAHQLVDYVFDRPVGEKQQEAGGVMVTLAALCFAQEIDMHAAGEAELARVWTKRDVIRAKQAAKPKHSPLPQHVSTAPRWRHKKRGSTYTEIGRGRLQAEDWYERFACPRAQGDGERSVDMAEVVAYQAEVDGSIWVRPVAEFEDGRFERIEEGA